MRKIRALPRCTPIPSSAVRPQAYLACSFHPIGHRPHAAPNAPPPYCSFPPIRLPTHLPCAALPCTPATTWSRVVVEEDVSGIRGMLLGFLACSEPGNRGGYRDFSGVERGCDTPAFP